jgi:protein phosphatase 1L
MPRKKARPTRIVKLDYGSAHTEKARYATREDRHFSFNLGGADDFRDGAFYLVGVIDGHRGAACAEEVARFLPSVIGGGSSFQDAFARMDRVVRDERSGACCCVAIVKGVLLEDAQPTLDVAWLGDCRAFVARRSGGVERLTADHSPEKERERIEAAGGMLVDDDGCVRVGVRPDDDDDDAKTVDLLAACRAFGDADFKRPKPVVVATPDVRTMQLDSDCEFIVLCTDGVYEGLPTDERVVEAVRAGIADDESGQAAAAGARAVVDAAVAGGATDDVTCVVLRTMLE